jgi:hypothetical protein
MNTVQIICLVSYTIGTAIRMNTQYIDDGILISDRELLVEKYMGIYLIYDIFTLWGLIYNMVTFDDVNIKIKIKIIIRIKINNIRIIKF